MGTRAYLDHASNSPLRPRALKAMLPFLTQHFADPGRVHSDGRVTRVAIEQAREEVAALVGARPREVVFTSGGTEAVNAAVYGALRRSPVADTVVTTAVEHSSVLDACRREPVTTVAIGVDAVGRFSAADVLGAITPATALVTIQLANHEVGTLQPAAEICATARERGVLVHVDACAAIGYTPVDFAALGADLMSVTAHSWGGPLGVGALVVRRGLRIPPFVVGGAQERDRRGGIENIPAIVGFGAAATDLAAELDSEAVATRAWSDRLRRDLPHATPGLTFHGDPVDGLPNLVCFGVDGVEAEPILLALDQRGIAIHSGSACSSESLEPSPVLAAMGADADHALRVSVGWSTTAGDVDRLLEVFPGIVDDFRRLRSP
ncbi:MAG: cysteine desulfurase family protein [Acidimicrobiia bacterium]